MRAIFVPALAFALIGAGEPPHSALDNPAYSTPPGAWRTMEDATARTRAALPEIDEAALQACRDAIQQAREASGQPPLLDREPASPEKPLAIHAVDRRQDTCSVLVMMGNREDIRPLPAPAEGPMYEAIPVEADE